jgi:hypothetical protein
MSLTIVIDSPVLTVDEFCRRTGAEASKIRRQMEAGNFPVFKFNNTRGAKRYVNMLAITQQAVDDVTDIKIQGAV